jgi:UDP-glucose 6-dehydrogenase
MEIYQSFSAPFFTCENYEVVELLKYVENLTDFVLISLWNEFLTVSDNLGVSRSEFIGLMNHLANRQKFSTVVRVPGQAVGMWCLPKDLAAFVHQFKKNNIHILQAASITNQSILDSYGENSYAGSELFHFEDRSFRFTELGQQYLMNVRLSKPKAPLDEKD